MNGRFLFEMLGDLPADNRTLLIIIDVSLDLLHELEEIILFQQIEVGFWEAAFGEELLCNVITKLIEVEITKSMLL